MSGGLPDRLVVVVSGLPASGKTTVARKLGTALGVPVVDKDEILGASPPTASPWNPPRGRASAAGPMQFSREP